MRAARAVGLLALVAVPAGGLVHVDRRPDVAHREPAAPEAAPAAARTVVGGAASAPVAAAALASAPAPAATESVMAPPPETFDAPPAAPAPPPALLRAASTSSAGGGGVWAVVIGIDDYPGSRSDLRASVYDADVVDYTLASYGVPANRRLVLRNTQATAAVIEQSIRWLVANAGSDSTAVLFYAGHVRQKNGSEWIVGADGRLVQDRRVAELLAPLAAQHTWVVMASCFGARFNEVLRPGTILTGAAVGLAYENATYANSYLVEYLFERAMMQGQAPETEEQSYAWAYAALQRDHPNRLPTQYDQVAGELRLGTPPSPSPPPSSPPPPPSSPPPSQPSTPPPDEDDPDQDGDCLLTIGGIAGCDDR